MHLGRVVGTVVATEKVEGLEGVKFLIVQPLDKHQNEAQFRGSDNPSPEPADGRRHGTRLCIIQIGFRNVRAQKGDDRLTVIIMGFNIFYGELFSRCHRYFTLNMCRWSHMTQ